MESDLSDIDSGESKHDSIQDDDFYEEEQEEIIDDDDYNDDDDYEQSLEDTKRSSRRSKPSRSKGGNVNAKKSDRIASRATTAVSSTRPRRSLRDTNVNYNEEKNMLTDDVLEEGISAEDDEEEIVSPAKKRHIRLEEDEEIEVPEELDEEPQEDIQEDIQDIQEDIQEDKQEDMQDEQDDLQDELQEEMEDAPEDMEDAPEDMGETPEEMEETPEDIEGTVEKEDDEDEEEDDVVDEEGEPMESFNERSDGLDEKESSMDVEKEDSSTSMTPFPKNKMLMSILDDNPFKKKLTEEELQLRRAENARKRKNLSEKRLAEEKRETLNKLLKKRAGKSRSKIDKRGETNDTIKPRRPYNSKGMIRILRTRETDLYCTY
ncbi:Ino eighty subunit 2 [Nakaseomyces bracarensis]|uniref:Ino eighty subunit 2 n=1 Tax=Nakaseomyces bracarensis TaxID=273131 RepID=A0ABR4NNK6_9SACH